VGQSESGGEWSEKQNAGREVMGREGCLSQGWVWGGARGFELAFSTHPLDREGALLTPMMDSIQRYE